MSWEDAYGDIIKLEKEPTEKHPGQYVELDDGSSFCVPADQPGIFDQLETGLVVHIRLDEYDNEGPPRPERKEYRGEKYGRVAVYRWTTEPPPLNTYRTIVVSFKLYSRFAVKFLP